MNRPNKETLTEWSLNSYADYTNELEKYCDELEKALDKACEHLVSNNICCLDICPFKEKENCVDLCTNKEKWKEWLLKNEKN